MQSRMEVRALEPEGEKLRRKLDMGRAVAEGRVRAEGRPAGGRQRTGLQRGVGNPLRSEVVWHGGGGSRGPSLGRPHKGLCHLPLMAFCSCMSPVPIQGASLFLTSTTLRSH